MMAAGTPDMREDMPMTDELLLREVIDDDIDVFFAQQRDPEANHMAAFTVPDPADEVAFRRRWQRIRSDPAIVARSIVVADATVGHVLSYVNDGRPEVSYWLGKAYWGQGYASRALQQFLQHVQPARPIYARVAADNRRSQRVLEKCGFTVIAEETGFAAARNAAITELVLVRHVDIEPLVQHSRIARPTDDLAAVLHFYRDALGMAVLAGFADHAGFDGVILGWPGLDYHLEFTHQRGHTVGRAPSQDHLLVLYLPDATTWQAAVARMRAYGYEPVPSYNPYWDQQGATFEDPDGYRVVLQQAAWRPGQPGGTTDINQQDKGDHDGQSV
jgi:RimJ/RimL family protein N-acetyltransferase/catechol 2,3-dioxygenase-like lactoylglutathione lyase family enzyme